MAGFISNLLLLTVQYVIMDCTRRSERMIYEPYGPRMCRQLCEDLGGTFFFIQERLSCPRVPMSETASSNTDSTKHCLMEMKRTIDAPAFAVICSNSIADVLEPNPLHLPTELSAKDDQYSYFTNSSISLHRECAERKLCMVKFILSHRPDDINTRDKLGRTPVMTAVMNNHVTVFDFLISQNCDLMAVDNNNDTVLHVACQAGDVNVVRKLVVNHTCDIDGRGGRGMTPILKSALYGNIDVVEFLVREGCNVSTFDDNMNTILHIACCGGHVDMVKYVFRNLNADIESRGEKGRTPVMIAAQGGHKGVVDFLVRKYCDINTSDDDRNTLLHVACIGGRLAMVKHILLKFNFTIDIRGKYGQTPVMTAARYGHRAVVEYLVSKQCDLKILDYYKNSVLHYACKGGFLDMVKYIISLQVNPINGKGEHKHTPVTIAAYHSHASVYMFLVNQGCNLMAIVEHNYNILDLACMGGCLDIVRHIVEKLGFSIERRGHGGWTPVMQATRSGYLTVVKYLVKKGCKLTVVDVRLNNVLHVACRYDHVHIVEYILSQTDSLTEGREQRIKRTPVMEAACWGHMSAFMCLVKHGCNLKVLDKSRDSILHVACMGGNVDIVKFIVENNVIGIDRRGENRWTPVMTAAYKGHISVFLFLVSKGCDLKTTDELSHGLLYCACIGGNVNIVKYIVEKLDFGIEHRGSDGWTPVMGAAYFGRLSVVKYLVGEGCNLAKTDDKGRDVLKIACYARANEDMLKYLKAIREWSKHC